MKSLTKSLKDIGFLTIALTLALAANFAYGQFSGPTAEAPMGNIDEPINVGDEEQTKSGDLRVWDFTSNSLTTNSIRSFGSVRADAGLRSPQYCDVAGQNCLTHAELVAAVAPVATGANCGTREHLETWRQYDNQQCGETTYNHYQCNDGSTILQYQSTQQTGPNNCP